MNKPTEKDFDQLVNQVNEKLDNFSQNKTETIVKKVQKTAKAILWFWMNNSQKTTEILFEKLYWANLKWLQPNQMDSILLASDIVRAFNKTKEKFEEEKIWKSTEIIEQIDQEILKTKELFDTIYNQYKKSFYRN